MAKTTSQRVRRPMVGWFDPSQLILTGSQILISTIFGEHADFRQRENRSDKAEPIDYSNREEIWIDYAADVGDGFNPTYAVAYCLAQETLATSSAAQLPRGHILILGGDQVYPIANKKEYRERLIGPYETALPLAPDSQPDVYAVPGNHDWYDSLVSYSRIFCAGKSFAGWQTRQDRSYFALKLPHGWWLVGTDVQLASDIDDSQLRFFTQIAERIEPGERVILCNAEPHWIYETKYATMNPEYLDNNLKYLEEKIFGNRVQVFIAGDLHHYRRHATADGQQKITCGGGGAFLHPTHEDESLKQLKDRYIWQASFPDPAVSRSLTWRNLLFAKLNPKFGMLTALAYLLLCWTLRPSLGGYGLKDWKRAIVATLETLIQTPSNALLVFGICLGFVLFTDTHSRLYRWLGGLSHGFSHLLAAFAIGWGVAYGVRSALGVTDRFLFATGVLLAIVPLAWLIGSTIMGLYLLVSLNVFGRHANEAFSSLVIQDWKSFLRMHIGRDGVLTIYVCGLPSVPRDWRPSTTVGSRLVPAHPFGVKLVETVKVFPSSKV